MSYENPAPLRVGATGTLDGKRWRVAGRTVMGMQADDGETYYWNEFNLVDSFGRSATLVYEEAENGPEWKLFKYFEPLRALTAAEASKLTVGDSVNLDGTPSAITLVDQSRVYHIEGTAPDGVEVGDVANYFNVDTGSRMLVVSWSGEDVEYYEGLDVPATQVASAFSFTAPASNSFTRSATSSFSNDETSGGGSSTAMKLIMGALGAIVLFGFFSCNTCGGSRRAVSTPPPPPKAAPAARLATGASGLLAEKSVTIASHATVEIARVGSRQGRHEYALLVDGGSPAILVNALSGNLHEWHLLMPVIQAAGEPKIGPYEAAARRRGGSIAVGGRTLHVSELFQAKTLSMDGKPAETLWPPLQYGFVARDGDESLVARWTERGIQFHRGRSIPEAQVLAALGGAKK